MESFTISWQIYSLLFINRLYSRISIVSRLRQGHKVFGFALFKGLVRLYMLPCMEQSGKGCLSYGKEDLVGSFGCCYKEVWRAVMGKDVTLGSFRLIRIQQVQKHRLLGECEQLSSHTYSVVSHLSGFLEHEKGIVKEGGERTEGLGRWSPHLSISKMGCCSVIECLPHMHKALVPSPVLQENK